MPRSVKATTTVAPQTLTALEVRPATATNQQCIASEHHAGSVRSSGGQVVRQAAIGVASCGDCLQL